VERCYAKWVKVRQDRLDTLVSTTWKKWPLTLGVSSMGLLVVCFDQFLEIATWHTTVRAWHDPHD
jgi:hypothetical protein